MAVDPDRLPRLIRRHRGGWLAVSPVGQNLQIAVSAETQDQAKDAYVEAENEWRAIIRSGAPS